MESVLLMLDVPKGAPLETLSGIQNSHPRVYARYERPGPHSCVAYVLVHPTNNFMSHYLVEPLRDRGRTVLAMNTRYLGNDTMLLMERAIQDLGSGMRFLRSQGFDKIVLIGNSGGASLAAFYQQQSENLTITNTPDNLPIDIKAEDLPPADALALLAAHPGRAATLTDSLDPAILSESADAASDPALDMYNPRNGPPYEPQWLERYRAAQVRRNERLTDYALTLIRTSRTGNGAFVVYRTKADPRTLDLTIDPNDRKVGAIWGDAKQINESANGLARFCTARSFLSQWSKRLARADGPKCVADTKVRILNMTYTADQAAFPSNFAAYSKSAGGRCVESAIHGVGHYPQDNAEAVAQIAETVIEWGG